MKEKELILKAHNALLESAKQHKRSSAAHRRQSKACMIEAVGLKQFLEEGEDESHGR